MKIIAGLGNPEKRYEATRHNVGFMALDYIADELGINIDNKKGKSLIAQTLYKGEKIILVKPQTYMNLSGESIQEISSYFKIPAQDILVIYDDLDLALGRIRIRPNGGTGGHNGVASIIQCLGTKEFNRLRIGIGRPPAKMNPVNYVLGVFREEECTIISELLPNVLGAAKEFMLGTSIENIMNKYNS